MSTKQQLAEAVESLPEDLPLEIAMERLYRLFKLKQRGLPARYLSFGQFSGTNQSTDADFELAEHRDQQ